MVGRIKSHGGIERAVLCRRLDLGGPCVVERILFSSHKPDLGLQEDGCRRKNVKQV